MTSVLDRVPLERISAQARSVHAGRLLLTLIAGFFFLLGWLAGQAFLAVVWCCVAVKVGWQEAKASRVPAG